MITLLRAAEIFRLEDVSFIVRNSQLRTSVSFTKADLDETRLLMLTSRLYAAGARFSIGEKFITFNVDNLA